ncbi:MAG: phosphoesterase, partial [Acidobacteriia bacterium]|nr:phosphoesterase [Terriglobia bacterium]
MLRTVWLRSKGPSIGTWSVSLGALLAASLCLLGGARRTAAQQAPGKKSINLPSSKILVSPVPGHPQRTNSFPTAAVLSPDGRYLALLNNGRGTAESNYQQSIAILDLSTNQVTDFPDARLPVDARQTYFLGLTFSSDGRELYASMASRTDPTGRLPNDTGNGIAVYSFREGHVAPERFLKIPLQPLAPGKRPVRAHPRIPKGQAVPYPAGLAVISTDGKDMLLVADNLSDDALLLDAATGQVLHRFDLSTREVVPASYPYAVVATRDGKRGYCSLWNASQVVELDLEQGRVLHWISLFERKSTIAPGSHPTAMLLSPDERRLYVTLSNTDRVAVVDTATAKVLGYLSTRLPGQEYGGSYPNALALSADSRQLFVADASADAVAIFNIAGNEATISDRAAGFIPTEWYPTALAVHGDDLFVVTGKGTGTGPNNGAQPP